jgi:D-serine deaminase-like pyridoxal phosphate-dependent protein
MNEPATPCLVIDAAVVRRNLKRYADYVAQHGLGLRPHTKTHKSVKLARMQLDAGAVGLTVAKAGEAQVMAEAGDDLLMAYPAVDRPRCDALAELAKKVTVRVAIDSQAAAEALADAATRAGSTIGILVDIDVGGGRTGVQTPKDALALAQFVDQQAGLRLDGIMCYPGQVRGEPAAQTPALKQVDATLAETIDLWRQHGLAALIVSGGSTPTAMQSHLVTNLTEIRPGTYVYNDMKIVTGGYCTLDDCAARFACTVVSDAVPDQVVIDAGAKTLTYDSFGSGETLSHGYLVEYPEARVTKLSEEHGQVDMTKCDPRPRVGERVTVIPAHICPCVNLQDQVWWKENGELEALRIDARGKLS